ncbi:HTH-like domain protein, partial [Burkholderia cenocepacia BC7]
MACEVRRHGGLGSPPAQEPRGGECPAEEAAGRSNARYGSVEGRRQGKALSPQAKREAVSAIRGKVNISERRACRLVGLSRSVLHYDAKPDHENEVLAARLVELAHERRRFGYRRLHALVEREGTHANHKRIYRLYREAGLAVRRRRKRHGVMIEREQLALPGAPNEVWSIDFVMDALSNGRRVKCLT